MGLPRTDRNHDAIFTLVDRFSNYVRLVPTTLSTDAQGATRLYIDHVFASHGLSKTIASDRDPRFTSVLASAPLHTQDTEIGLGALV